MRLEYRPFAVLGFTTAAVLLACVYLSRYAAVISIAAGVILLILTLSIRKLRTRMLPYFLAIALLLSGTIFLVRDSGFSKAAEAFDGKSCELSAVITEEAQRKNARVYYMAQAEAADGETVDFSVRLSLPYELDIQIGDQITMPAVLYKLGANSDDVALYYMSQGVRLGAYPDSSKGFDSTTVQITYADAVKPERLFTQMRNDAERRIYEKLPNEYGALINGMLFGDTGLLSDETQDAINEAGIVPLFAVSGMHLSIWVLGLFEILQQLNVRKKLNSVIGILFTLFFMAITGMSVSVCRAGIMMMILLSGNLFHRRSDSLNSLGLAAFVLCVYEPYIVADVGFLFSFTATAGILLLYPHFETHILSRLGDRVFLRPIKVILSAAAVSFCATIGAFPIQVFFLRYFSVWTILTNVLLAYLAPACMLLGGFSAMLYPLAFLSDFAALLSGVLAKAMLFLIRKIASFAITTISTADDFWQYGTMIALCFLLFIVLAFRGRRAVKTACAGLLIIAVTVSSCSYVYYDGRMQAEIINCASSYSVIIHDKHFKAVFGCPNSYYTAAQITESLDYVSRKDADMLFLPKKQSEHSETYSLLQSNHFDAIITKGSSASFMSLTDGMRVVNSGNYEYALTNGAKLYFYDTDKLSFGMLTFSDKKVLFLFHAEVGAVLPQECQTADCLVCAEPIPESIGKSTISSVIVCGLPIVAETIAQDSGLSGAAIVKAGNYNSVTVNVKNSKIKIIAREG